MPVFDKFYVPKQLVVFKTIIDNHVEHNKYMKEVILEHRQSKPESNTSNVKAWHSSWITHLENPKFQPVVDMTESACNYIASLHPLNSSDAIFQVTNLWAMMYEDGETTKRHAHFPCVFSACYYIDVEPDCAPIIFESIQNDGVNDHNLPLEIQPENGMLLIWPSILEHEVPPTKGKRMCISLNIDKKVLIKNVG